MSLPEPPDLAFVRTGRQWPWTFWQRDDREAKDGDYKPGCRWWNCSHEDGGEYGPATWEKVLEWPEPLLVQLTEMEPIK